MPASPTWGAGRTAPRVSGRRAARLLYILPVLAWETVAEANPPDGARWCLVRRGDEWAIRAGGRVLMTSRTHGSEEALADRALRRVPRPSDVLVGGLGMGFTLRAALERLPPGAHVWVAELVPELVAWNREWLAHLAGHPLEDPRVRVLELDVLSCVRRRQRAFDAILLDVDNGPAARMTAVGRPANAELYDPSGARALHAALRPGGVVAVWSAGPAPAYLRTLAAAGLEASQETARARGDRGGRRDAILLGVRPGGHDRGPGAG